MALILTLTLDLCSGAQVADQSFSYQKVCGSMPGPCGLHVEVSLGKRLNHNLPLMCKCLPLLKYRWHHARLALPPVGIKEDKRSVYLLIFSCFLFHIKYTH